MVTCASSLPTSVVSNFYDAWWICGSSNPGQQETKGILTINGLVAAEFLAHFPSTKYWREAHGPFKVKQQEKHGQLALSMSVQSNIPGKKIRGSSVYQYVHRYIYIYIYIYIHTHRLLFLFVFQTGIDNSRRSPRSIQGYPKDTQLGALGAFQAGHLQFSIVPQKF